MQRAAEHLALPVRRRIADETRVLDAAQEVLHREVDLQARQRPADAAVDPTAPAEVLVVRALDSNFSGSGNLFGSRLAAPYSRCTTEPAGMTVPPTSMSAVALRLGKNWTADCSRRTSSIAFGISSGLLAQEVERLGVAQQRQHAVRDGVDRRVMTGDQKQLRVRRSLLRGPSGHQVPPSLTNFDNTLSPGSLRNP